MRRLLALVPFVLLPAASAGLTSCGCEASVVACLTGDANHNVFPFPEIPEVGVGAVPWHPVTAEGTLWWSTPPFVWPAP